VKPLDRHERLFGSFLANEHLEARLGQRALQSRHRLEKIGKTCRRHEVHHLLRIGCLKTAGPTDISSNAALASAKSGSYWSADRLAIDRPAPRLGAGVVLPDSLPPDSQSQGCQGAAATAARLRMAWATLRLKAQQPSLVS
jgi:hypothetical protein